MKRIIIVLLLLIPAIGYCQEIGNHLILQDIGEYKYRPKRTDDIYGNSGILIGADHFMVDHVDVTYSTRYVHPTTIVGVSVQVTQHAGSDSDKWLLHEIDRDFRNYYGLPGRSYGPRQINGQTVLESATGGRNYRWLSEKKVIMIEYNDPQMTKAEPIEIVRAYLAKHPSSLPAMNLAGLRSTESKTKWIQDEMERRLWICDKWFLQVQIGKVEMNDVLQTIVKCLNIFLDYREKYYGVTKSDEKAALWGYLDRKDGTSVKNKLTEYKSWWNVNKARAINLP
jgi:hypothetical protein